MYIYTYIYKYIYLFNQILIIPLDLRFAAGGVLLARGGGGGGDGAKRDARGTN